MPIAAGHVLDKISQLRAERSAIIQGIEFFKHERYKRIRRILEVEKLKIEEEIEVLESIIRAIDTNIVL